MSDLFNFIKDLKMDGTFNEMSFEREYESKWSGSVADAFFNSEDDGNIIRIDATDVQEIASRINKIVKSNKLKISATSSLF